MGLFFYLRSQARENNKAKIKKREQTDVVATESKESGDTTVSSVEVGDRGGSGRDVGHEIRREETKEASVLWIQVTLHNTDTCDWEGFSVAVLFLV